MKKTIGITVLLLLISIASVCNADLLVTFVRESSLPYQFSPSNYENSPSNYDNSVSNYDNSPSNYDNSESNYDNSPSNYDNSANGGSSLVLKENGRAFRVGYYVRADNGVLNFFSTTGKRLFYNPENGVAVFHGKKGFFCGVLGRVDGKYKLALTEKGEKVLELAQ